jgi:hypothetical protein
MDIDEPESLGNQYDQVDETGQRATPEASTSSRSSSAAAIQRNTGSLHSSIAATATGVRGDSPIKIETDGQLPRQDRKYTPEGVTAPQLKGHADITKPVQKASPSPRQKQRSRSAEVHHVPQGSSNPSAPSLVNGHSLHELTVPDEDDETSEAEQRLAPLPPAIDNSSDEDYEEHLRNRSASKQRRVNGNAPLSSGGSAGSLKGGRKGVTAGKKAAAARARAAAAAQRLDSNSKIENGDTSPNGHLKSGKADREVADDSADEALEPRSAEPAEHREASDQDSDAEEPSITNTARIVVTDTASLGTENDPEYAEVSQAASLPMVSIDTEDAMSAVSDDTPLLFKAAARVQEHQDNSTLSRIPTLAVTDMYKAGIEAIDTPTTPITHAPSPPPSSRGRGRSSAAGRGRGRGRGGRGKRASQQQRLLGVEDHDASAASAIEDVATEGLREGSPHPDTPAVSDHEEGKVTVLRLLSDTL